MADIKIVKLKIRRGTNAQRKSTVLDQGELGYTTDTKRLFIGNGVLSGGLHIGAKIHPPLSNYASLSDLNAETGDMVMANNLVYQLTGSNYSLITDWANISQQFNSSTFEYNAQNVLDLKTDSVSPTKLNSSLVTNGVIIDGGELKASINSNHFTISANEITIKPDGIGKYELSSDAFTNGLTGGSGLPVGINLDPTTLYLKFGTQLSVSAFPSNSVTFNSLDSSWFGAGLIFDTPNQKVKTVVTDVDSTTIYKDITGRISLLPGLLSGTNELASVATDTYGRVLFNRNSIYDTVSCISGDPSSPLSSIFSGTPNQSLSGALDGVPITTFTVISSNSTGNVSLTLSSAGFIMFQGGSTARQDGKYIGRFAIPIFTY